MVDIEIPRPPRGFRTTKVLFHRQSRWTRTLNALCRIQWRILHLNESFVFISLFLGDYYFLIHRVFCRYFQQELTPGDGNAVDMEMPRAVNPRSRHVASGPQKCFLIDSRGKPGRLMPRVGYSGEFFIWLEFSFNCKREIFAATMLGNENSVLRRYNRQMMRGSNLLTSAAMWVNYWWWERTVVIKMLAKPKPWPYTLLIKII